MRYSARLAWQSAPNTYSVALAKERNAGRRLIDLTVANPTVALGGYPHIEIAQALAAVSDFRYEPRPFGLERAREEVARWYAAQGLTTEVERIALTASTSEAYSLLFKLLCDPGDEVLVPAPSYPLFEYLAKADAVVPVAYRLGYDGKWFLDIGSLESGLSERTRAVAIVNPNNPTGSFLKREELRVLTEFARRHKLAVLSDEVFQSYGNGVTPDCVRSFIGHNEVLSFSLSGLAKAAGMPQMKLSWMVVNGPAREVAEALSHLEILLDSYLSVNQPVQQALGSFLQIGALVHRAIQRRLKNNYQTLTQLPAASGIQQLAMEGGWSAILRLPNVLSEEEWISRLLMDHGTIVHPGYFYDMAAEAYIVVSLLSAEADLAEGLGNLAKMVPYSKAGLSPDHERS